MSPKQLRSVLAASDLGEGSDAGLRVAAALAARAAAELHVFHCVTQPVFPYWEGLVDTATRERWLAHARQDLEWQLRRVLGEEASPTTLTVTLGEPTREITERAAQVSADMIVLGPHHPRAVLDDLLGSTADRVIRSAAVPCLIANQPLALPLSRVLLPTDFSAPARRALEVAVDWLAGALARHGEEGSSAVVEILYVSAFASPSARPIAVEPRLAGEVEAARERLPPGSSLRLLPRIISAPLPVDGILRVAEQIQAELIVLGTHGYGTLGRALIGSVASSVARMVPFPILLVPPPS